MDLKFSLTRLAPWKIYRGKKMKHTGHREVEMGRVNSMVERLSRDELGCFSAFAFGSTHTPNIKLIARRLGPSVSILHEGPSFTGLWRLIPLPKPRDFSFQINDRAIIPNIFESLNDYLLISFLLVDRSESDLAKGLISHGQFNLLEIENALTAPFILWTYDLDSCEFESGMSEDYVVSEQVSNDVRAILMI